MKHLKYELLQASNLYTYWLNIWINKALFGFKIELTKPSVETLQREMR
jgi:hypothetical protein